MNKEIKNQPIKRRNFISIIFSLSLFTWLAAVLYPVFKYLLPPEVQEVSVKNINIGEINEFPINSSKIVRFGRKPVLVVRKDSGEFRALSAKCTHLDCNVQYKSDTKQIWCACHNGFYNLEGKNISGPPPEPLSQYIVNIIDEKIMISKDDLS
jgi:cytochrome b6-f complex iron-sulfur subunit